jgi:hypothetical protein
MPTASPLFQQIFGLVMIFIIVGAVIIFKKKIFAVLVDFVLASVVYFGAIFAVTMFGIIIPAIWLEGCYPLMLIGFVIYHVYSNLASTPASKPFGAL